SIRTRIRNSVLLRLVVERFRKQAPFFSPKAKPYEKARFAATHRMIKVKKIVLHFVSANESLFGARQFHSAASRVSRISATLLVDPNVPPENDQADRRDRRSEGDEEPHGFRVSHPMLRAVLGQQHARKSSNEQ